MVAPSGLLSIFTTPSILVRLRGSNRRHARHELLCSQVGVDGLLRPIRRLRPDPAAVRGRIHFVFGSNSNLFQSGGGQLKCERPLGFFVSTPHNGLLARANFADQSGGLQGFVTLPCCRPESRHR
jgi:hypothetical protein